MNNLRDLAGDVDRALSRLADAVKTYVEAAAEKRKTLVGKPARTADLHFVANSSGVMREVFRTHPPLARLIGINLYRDTRTFAQRHPKEPERASYGAFSQPAEKH